MGKMPTPAPAEAPVREEVAFDLSDMQPHREFEVILHNDDEHSMEEVTLQIIRALGCSVARAKAIMFEAHLKGQARVIIAAESRALRVAAVLREIGLGVTVRRVN